MEKKAYLGHEGGHLDHRDALLDEVKGEEIRERMRFLVPFALVQQVHGLVRRQHQRPPRRRREDQHRLHLHAYVVPTAHVGLKRHVLFAEARVGVRRAVTHVTRRRWLPKLQQMPVRAIQLVLERHGLRRGLRGGPQERLRYLRVSRRRRCRRRRRRPAAHPDLVHDRFEFSPSRVQLAKQRFLWVNDRAERDGGGGGG